MATRFEMMPPTRADGNEVIKYKCLECGKEHIENLDTHVLLYRHAKHMVVDTRFQGYYSQEAQDA